MDKHYCIIRLVCSHITLYLFEDESLVKPTLCFVSDSSNSMRRLIDCHNIFKKFSVSHIFYISQEIYKAELSLVLGQQYVQS